MDSSYSNNNISLLLYNYSPQTSTLNSHTLIQTNWSPNKNTPHSSLNVTKSRTPYEEEDSIDEKLIQENLLIDPTNLDKTYSYLDCEINDSLPKKIKDSLLQILKDNKEVFATSKLDIGKFTPFQVYLQIDKEIPRQQQRPMSEEKSRFADKTLKTFEKLS